MSVRCVRVYPEFPAEDTERKKRAMVKKLREVIQKESPVNTYLRYYIKVCCAESHSHSMTSSHLSQQINKDLAIEIKRLVNEGITSTREVKLLLQEYVKSKFADNKMLCRLSKAFFPEDSVIYTHVHRTLFSNKKEQMDQEVLQQTINEWKIQNSDDLFFYRPYEDVGDVKSLLFCYQSKWQQKLLLRYGSVCLLDATYKTTKYALPLFFLAVKTNVGYSVVGTFIVQSESTESIAEALKVFQEWLPEWHPQFWMTDFSEAEIGAIDKIFPESTVYLCSFHREQAWLRWVRKSGNVTNGDAEEILSMWRAIAASRDEVEFHVNVEEMNTSNIMQRNPKASHYFATWWLSHECRRAQAYSEKDFVTIIHTNNGIESQNKVLKHSYLCHSSDKSLTGMLKIVINNYLPDVYRKYCSKNSTVKLFNSEIPSYLINRPQHFIKHVLTRISAARFDFSKDSITEISEGIFGVQSSTDREKFYCVNFDNATCTCMDFITFRFPWKHMCAIFEFVPNWSFLHLNSAYTNSPYITLDLDNAFCSVTGFITTNSENDWAANQTYDPKDNISKHQPLTSPTLTLQRKVRNAAKMLTDFSYICTDNNALAQTEKFLLEELNNLKKTTKGSSGLHYLNQNDSEETQIIAKKIKQKYKMLPLRRKRKQHSKSKL
ncbi:uncharacterized protein LOC134540254 isoform X4 [Bacillus rossius redtenbacheri]|uniref:uncharacterized protein LOC134540254 isoform X4 n=1 Tax=Bacillus rossius redtenbacheri TaxID=93214 RepID=UPI002FDCB56B